MSAMNVKSLQLSEPVMGGNEWKYVKECFDTGWVSSAGKFVDRFEEVVARYLGVSCAVAVVNGTAALHLSLLVLGVKENDEVLVPTLTFIAPVNAVRYVGAYPVFMDCDPATACLDVKKVHAFFNDQCEYRADGFTYNKKSGRRIAAVVPVHIFGHPADMEPLRILCSKMNVRLIEDATESLGSSYRGKKAGTMSDIGCLSFNGNKIITTGGGGMLLTDNKEWAARARHLSTQAKKDPFTYDHDEIGYNYRLTNIQAAFGVAQMEVLDTYIARKRAVAKYYEEAFKVLPQVEFLRDAEGVISNAWLSTIRVSKEDRMPLLEYLCKAGVQARPIWRLIHTLPIYAGYEQYAIEHAPEIWESGINIPCSVSITDNELNRVVDAIASYYRVRA